MVELALTIARFSPLGEAADNGAIGRSVPSRLPKRRDLASLDAIFKARANMGNRLSKIVTRTGDGGSTGLGDGSRVAKDSARIEAIGTVDELNSTIGLLLADKLPAAIAHLLTDVQHDLFDLGGELSIPGHRALADARVAALESAVETFNAKLPPLKEFILPGGTRGAGVTHVARTVCRRAERTLVTLAGSAEVSDVARRYLNRLSDLLFVLARTLNRSAECSDVLWQSRRVKAATAAGKRAAGVPRG